MTGSPVGARFDSAIDETPDTRHGVTAKLGVAQAVDKNWGHRNAQEVDVHL